MTPWIKTAFVGTALGLAGPVAATELIVDGGFEQQIVTTPGLFQSGFVVYNPGSTFGGPTNATWRVIGSGSNIAVTSTTEFTNGPTVYNGHSGLQWIDLTGDRDNGAAVGIEQSVATMAGQTYQLSFWLGAFVDAPTAVNVLVNGLSIGTFTNPLGGTSPGNGMNWVQFSQSVTATGPTTTLGFVYANGRSAAGLDDVSFTSPTAAVPEPATWAMMILGFGLVGAAARRRRPQSIRVTFA